MFEHQGLFTQDTADPDGFTFEETRPFRIVFGEGDGRIQLGPLAYPDRIGLGFGIRSTLVLRHGSPFRRQPARLSRTYASGNGKIPPVASRRASRMASRGAGSPVKCST
ncbi:hypothetical protein SAMN05421504_105258 [Amycolatopsis xylanica]|uniref:Uncharacterized protein n=1 Tax=Amycolatopsis xylanica TaxID=589385 RepID=A0A1H3J5L0_9PSEU|nr:hypothetical protein SAMN05421504_105258 [Amycolatopsis xylanica]